MIKVSRILCLLAVPGVVVAAGAAHFARISQAPTDAPEQHMKIVDVTAKKYEFAPFPIRVPLGATVQLRITSLDKTHGLKMNLYPDGSPAKGQPGLLFASDADCFKIEPSTATMVQFAARTPGTYSFHCCNRCGLGHGGMKGQLVVEP
jgi:cytochrome c oxidase subunit II